MTMTPAKQDAVSDRGVRLRTFLRICSLETASFVAIFGAVQVLTSDAADWAGRLQDGGRGVLWGLGIGIVLSLIVAQQQWRAAVAVRDRRLADDPAASPIPETGVRIRRTVRVPLPRAEVVRLLPGAATALNRSAQLEVNDPAAGEVSLSTPWSMSGWGERMVLTAGTDDDGSTPVTITSRPLLRIAVIDGGRNAANVERIVTWLRTASEDDPRSGPDLV